LGEMGKRGVEMRSGGIRIMRTKDDPATTLSSQPSTHLSSRRHPHRQVPIRLEGVDPQNISAAREGGVTLWINMMNARGAVNSGRRHRPGAVLPKRFACSCNRHSAGEKPNSDSATLVRESPPLVWSPSSDTTFRAASPVRSVAAATVFVPATEAATSDSETEHPHGRFPSEAAPTDR
jgi:hypothetical protein